MSIKALVELRYLWLYGCCGLWMKTRCCCCWLSVTLLPDICACSHPAYNSHYHTGSTGSEHYYTDLLSLGPRS